MSFPSSSIEISDPLVKSADLKTDLKITDRAFNRIAEITAQETKDKQSPCMLRLTITGGGCGGFQYQFSLDTKAFDHDNDKTFSHGQAVLVVDKSSLELLQGAEIDFTEDLAGSSFMVRNPNATSSCGCGVSFSIF